MWEKQWHCEFGIPSPPIVGNGMEVRLIKH